MGRRGYSTADSQDPFTTPGDANGTAGGNFVRDFQLDLTAPAVASVTPSGSVGLGPTQFVVAFNENLQMNVATVTNPANYGLISTIRTREGAAWFRSRLLRR